MNSVAFGTKPASAIEVAIPCGVLYEKNAAASTSRSFAFGCRAASAVTALGLFLCAGCTSLSGCATHCTFGLLVTSKVIPKDVDLLVTIERTMDLTPLARAGRRLKGLAQTINLGADIFLADTSGHYLGRICHYRECHPRAACRAQHCGLRAHLNDDLHVVTLSKDLIALPPVELWPKVVRTLTVAADVEEILLTKLERDQ